MISSLIQRLPRQFTKFCIVGSSSMVIDLGLLFILVQLARHHYQAQIAVDPNLGVFVIPTVAKIFSFAAAVTNGYYWNRRWTFARASRKRIRYQYTQFVLVNVVGMGINLLAMNRSMVLLKHLSLGIPDNILYLPATILAVAVSVFWNFFANKHWTFS
ncbi:MAG: GtrA family protein [Armatimonadetes bacterium]|nr:GtrA family protein [Armatimonadota bacterium]